MKIDVTRPIGRFAAEIPGAMGIFESFGIDYASLCDRSLEDAAHAGGVAPDIVVAGLRRLHAVQEGESWSDRPLMELTRHLAQQHHHFVRHELGRLALLLSDACSADERVPPDLVSLRAAFTRLSETLLPHFRREEANVFRTVEALEKAWQSGGPVPVPDDLAGSLRQLWNEHGAISAQLHTLRELRERLETGNELAPRCRTILTDLAALEAHVHEYMFLENWILFPRAAALAESRELPKVMR
jgi:regulator of cell morphogenesis and NO signaling